MVGNGRARPALLVELRPGVALDEAATCVAGAVAAANGGAAAGLAQYSRVLLSDVWLLQPPAHAPLPVSIKGNVVRGAAERLLAEIEADGGGGGGDAACPLLSVLPPSDEGMTDDEDGDTTPKRGRGGGGGGRNEGFDSMRLMSLADDPETASDELGGGGGEHGGAVVVTKLNMYGVATMAMVYAHVWPHLASPQTPPHAPPSQLPLLPLLPIVATFCILAGVADRRHGWRFARLRHGLLVCAVVSYLFGASTLPKQIDGILERRLLLPLLSAISQEQQATPPQPASPARSQLLLLRAEAVCPHLAWWASALGTWRLLGWLVARAFALPEWAMPLVAVAAHLASGLGVGKGGGEGACPLVRAAECAKWRRQWHLPSAGFSAGDDDSDGGGPVSPLGLSELWVFYAAVPLLLPRDFPAELPLSGLARRLAASLSCRLGSRLRGRLCGRHDAPRLPWLVVAMVFQQGATLLLLALQRGVGVAGAIAVGAGMAAATGTPSSSLFERLYSEAAALMLRGGGASHPFGTAVGATLTTPLAWLVTRPYASLPTVRVADPASSWWGAAAASLLLDTAGVLHAILLVIALAAAVPRRRVLCLTTVGAGSLAVYLCHALLARPVVSVVHAIGGTRPVVALGLCVLYVAAVATAAVSGARLCCGVRPFGASRKVMNPRRVGPADAAENADAENQNRVCAGSVRAGGLRRVGVAACSRRWRGVVAGLLLLAAFLALDTAVVATGLESSPLPMMRGPGARGRVRGSVRGRGAARGSRGGGSTRAGSRVGMQGANGPPADGHGARTGRGGVKGGVKGGGPAASSASSVQAQLAQFRQTQRERLGKVEAQLLSSGKTSQERELHLERIRGIQRQRIEAFENQLRGGAGHKKPARALVSTSAAALR